MVDVRHFLFLKVMPCDFFRTVADELQRQGTSRIKLCFADGPCDFLAKIHPWDPGLIHWRRRIARSAGELGGTS